MIKGGVCVVDLESLTVTALGSNPARDFGFFHVSLIAYGTSVVLLRCPLVTEIMDGHLKSSAGKSPYDFSRVGAT